jgi:nucleotide-binding universal stress UspA family protein
MLRTILVPLDGSTFGEQALPTALRIAARHGARLVIALVHEAALAPAHTQGAPPVDPVLDTVLRRAFERYLEEIAGWLRGSAPVRVTTTLLEGPVVPSLVAAVEAEWADLVVMTTHGRGGLSRAWLGSVADALVRRATPPVLLVKPEASATRTRAAAAFDHVLVPLDGYPFSEDAIDHAAAVAGAASTRYTLLRVLSPIVTPVLLDYAASVPFDIGIERPEAERYLAELADRLRLRGLLVDTSVVVEAQPARAILEFAESNGVDLISMATHARHGLGRLLLGSVADKVLRGSAVPVLLHRPMAAELWVAKPAPDEGATVGAAG